LSLFSGQRFSRNVRPEPWQQAAAIVLQPGRFRRSPAVSRGCADFESEEERGGAWQGGAGGGCWHGASAPQQLPRTSIARHVWGAFSTQPCSVQRRQSGRAWRWGKEINTQLLLSDGFTLGTGIQLWQGHAGQSRSMELMLAGNFRHQCKH
jgi:hypothetical protein